MERISRTIIQNDYEGTYTRKYNLNMNLIQLIKTLYVRVVLVREYRIAYMLVKFNYILTIKTEAETFILSPFCDACDAY